MTSRRCYQQYCGLARGLDVIGGRWTLLIVRELLLGARRYTDLMEGLPGITTNMLAERLKEMEGEGLIERRRTPAPTPASVYALTKDGMELEPVVMAIGRWGGRLMGAPQEGDAVNIGWGLIAMKRRYVGVGAAKVGLVIEGRGFMIEASGGAVEVREGAAQDAPVQIRGDLVAFRGLLFEGAGGGDLEEAGALEVEGDRGQWEAWLAAFGLKG